MPDSNLKRSYRSVKVAVRNNTGDLLNVVGLAVLRGQWTDKMAPRQGEEIVDTATWATESTMLGEGTKAFVRLGSTRGFLMLSWNLPWTGNFEFDVKSAEGVRESISIDDAAPDAVAVLVTFD
jgi:hypothetical protein